MTIKYQEGVYKTKAQGLWVELTRAVDAFPVAKATVKANFADGVATLFTVLKTGERSATVTQHIFLDQAPQDLALGISTALEAACSFARKFDRGE